MSLGLAVKLKELPLSLSPGCDREKGWHLLTAQVGSSGEVAGGPHAHQEDGGTPAQEGWMWQELRILEGISFL